MKLSKFIAAVNPQNIKIRHKEHKTRAKTAKVLDDFELEEMADETHFRKAWGCPLDEEAVMNSYQQPGVEM